MTIPNTDVIGGQGGTKERLEEWVGVGGGGSSCVGYTATAQDVVLEGWLGGFGCFVKSMYENQSRR
jgi:hypothetical protein